MSLWRCFITLLLSRSGPLLGSCQVFDDSLGHLRVDLASPFLLGSDLRVYCHINKCGWRSKVSLVLKPKDQWKRDNWIGLDCSSVVEFRLPDVQWPRFDLICRLHEDSVVYVVGGIDLHGGWPPDKPENITCETTSPSPWVECRWRAGRDTHVVTSYKVSLSSENGTWNWTSEADNVALPKAKLDVNQRYQLVVSADNRFGRSRSDPFMLQSARLLIPQSPHITQVYFGNSSTLAAVLRWRTPEDLSQLSASVRLRPANSSSWEVREATRLSQDEVRVDGLEPLVDYQFQIRMCTKGTSKCSKWSSDVMSRSPGKGPTQPLRVWRILSNHKSSSLQTVTVLWKAPPPETFSGQVEHYKIDLGRGPAVREVICTTSLCRFPLKMPSDLAALAVSVVTTYGTSPPAIVPLSLSGDLGPALRLGYPTANGSAVLVSWELTRPRVPGSEELYYVLEWTSVPVGHRELGWMQVSMDQNNATITGMSLGVRYNISVYVVNTRGVSTSSSILAYSGQLKPDAGPRVSVLHHNSTHLLVQWEDPAVERQRGFINNYTIYLRTPHVRSQEIPVAVAASHQKQARLKCPLGSVAIQMSASTAAGEGPRGNLIYSRPAEPAGGLAMLVFPVLAVVAVLVRLACWSCVRQRIKARCASGVPDWLVEKLPKPEKSQAIKLLEQDAIMSEPSFSDTDSDPPLSPISFASGEDSYPPVPPLQHRAKPKTSFLEPFVIATLDHSYKPQLTVAPQAEPPDQDQTPPRGDDSGFSGFGLNVGNLLSSLEMDSSGWPRTPGSDCGRDNWRDGEDHPPAVDLQGDTVVEVVLTGDYIPQICIPSSGRETE
ncbi:interleukin-23 receptor isoform X1 [Hippocampus zosterae]|uniref:interleukin-23 receptor isoform X1 n=1 Tax=Hippocampus zosterae TaxID=109293 RepID=UPI00223DD0C6|nr:interleukin-23 receptor isoform X1 [Hippocampus zosterae]